MKNELTFEEALTKLEKIVRELESGEASLDKSVKLFEEGVKLSALCSKYLKEAQQKVEILTSDGAEVKEFKADE